MNIEKILELRNEKKWTRYKLAKMSNVPISTLYDIEKRINLNPRIDTVKKIATALEVDINEII